MLRKCVSYHKNPHLSNPFTKPSHTNQPSSTATMAHPSPSDHKKLSLSSQPSSAALMAHPTPGNPLNPPSLINPTLPPEAPHSHHYLPPGIEQPGRRVPVGYDSAGGELILGWRKSALFYKSPLSERLQDASSDFCKTLLADSRQPRSQPPTKPRLQAAHASRASLFTKKSRTSHIPQPVQLKLYNYKLTHHQPRQPTSQ